MVGEGAVWEKGVVVGRFCLNCPSNLCAWLQQLHTVAVSFATVMIGISGVGGGGDDGVGRGVGGVQVMGGTLEVVAPRPHFIPRSSTISASTRSDTYLHGTTRDTLLRHQDMTK